MAPLFVNDYSFHGQFSLPDDVLAAVRELRRLSKICTEYSDECFCSKALLGNRLATASSVLRDVILSHGKPDIRRLILAWIDKQGPFWDVERIHEAGDWYFITNDQSDEGLVTDSAVAECAARIIFDQQHAGLISVVPSDFSFTPVIAGIRDDGGIIQSCDVPNHWMEAPLREFLSSSISVQSWAELRGHALARFPHLVFSPDTFKYLKKTPFSQGLRDRILALLDILNRISEGTDSDSGSLAPQALELREKVFVGSNALFTDSSDSEKQRFITSLTFLCPVRQENHAFTWHGKIRMGAQYRIHFAWPKPVWAQGLPVVYIGPKITKR